jgi:hypothetical protein
MKNIGINFDKKHIYILKSESRGVSKPTILCHGVAGRNSISVSHNHREGTQITHVWVDESQLRAGKKKNIETNYVDKNILYGCMVNKDNKKTTYCLPLVSMATLGQSLISL